MRQQSYRKSLILIVVTAAVLTAAQVYFTIQNYEVNKQRFILDVQQSLDASIENYFAGKARNSIYILGEQSFDTLVNGKQSFAYASTVTNIDSLLKVVDDSQSGGGTTFTHIWSGSENPDSTYLDSTFRFRNERSVKKLKISADFDSSRARELQFLTQKVMVSISEDLIDLGALYTEFQKQLEEKNLDVNFTLSQESSAGKTKIGTLDGTNYLSASATSAFLDSFNSISVDFENATLIILKNGIGELVLSVLLIGLVIGTLIHLYQTINAQKQLAAIKDDLISNITHEFKTPIATIFSALEGVTNFNDTNDQEKTRKYLALSNDQLHKLNDMVEKMLETATIDQGQLTLNKEEVEVVAWTEAIVKRFQLVAQEKQIVFESSMESAVYSLDRFHIENTLSNLIDNAIKYGGDKIIVRLSQVADATVWDIEDNGGNIPVSQRSKIFDKLYRIPTGNQHDVKGFGIGLYYARTIVELHGGQLTLNVSNGRTIFSVAL
ncbi:HAMP domain-containing sensor histidine kinase [Ekhidna sp.]|uniref:sensor histidine kinase n=1 Tax=Ekhidna sp. TaxID=2608089 RepID=UPI003296CB58